jgi:DNA-binding transcriptional LysR family regulator
MELRHLQALLAVSENGSFSQAATALGTVQSNVSAHVARLEREVGALLVDRSAGTLTAEGEVVASRAYRVLAELESMTADLASLRAEIEGTVRAGMIGTTARWLVPMLLADLSVRHPKLRLVVAEGGTSTLEPQLAASRLDLAVLSAPLAERDLTFEALFDEEIVLVVARQDELLAGRDAIEPHQLDDIEMLVPAPGTPFRSELDNALVPAGVKLRGRAELDGVRLIASLTFEGYGPALLPAGAVPAHLRQRFRLIPVRGLPRRRVGLALRRRGLPSAAARAVLASLRRIAATPDQLPPGLEPVVPDAVARAEGSLRAVGVPNG